MLEPRSAVGAFVGRQREMAEFKAALDDALAGHGRLVMLVGEPGIGKTRTTQELASHAEEQGAKVLWGWCYEEAGAPPYWPWVQPIRAYVQQAGAEQLAAQMGPGAADIAEIIPELLAKLPGLETPPALEPEAARFRLFDSITSFLKNAAQSQPLMLVLDDLHWADKPSLLLLEFLARQMADSRLLVVGCYRDVELSRQHPLSESLAQLSREPVFRRQMLRGLNQEDTGPFVEATAGVQVPHELADALYSHTEGNPFFLNEVIRLLADQGELVGQDAGGPRGIRVPEGVREVIGRRLNRLSQHCNQILQTASIVGREFDFGLLNALDHGSNEGDLLTAVEQAVGAYLIEEVPGAGERYRFTHALIQETLAAELTTSRRVRLHAQIAEALEGLYGANVEAHAAELAHHFAEAEPMLGPDKLVRYSLLAGENALAAFAYEEALGYFQIGLEGRSVLLGGTEPAPDGETAALLLGLGRVQGATLDRYRLPEAVSNLRRAFDYYAASGNVVQAVAVPQYLVRGTAGLRSGIAQLVSRALKLVSPDSIEAGRLLLRQGEAIAHEEGEYDRAQGMFNQAMTIARRERDTVLEMQTLAASAREDYAHLYFRECLEKGLRAVELAQYVDEPQAELSARYSVERCLLVKGDFVRAGTHGTAMLALSEKLRDRSWMVSALWLNERKSCLEGDWSAARAFSDRGLTTLSMDPRLLGTRTLLEYQVGEFRKGNVHLARLLEVMSLTRPGPTLTYGYPAIVIPMAAWTSGVPDRLDVAEAAGDSVLAAPSAIPFVACMARVGLALLAILRGGAEAAKKQYAALESQRGMMLPMPMVMAADHLLGLLAQTMGNLDRAAAHFEDALEFCRKAGYRPELAWTCHDYAETLLHPSTGSGRTDVSDRSKSMALLDEALHISTELGMKPLLERVTALQEQLGSQPAPPPSYPDGLTQREVEVLRLVAAGKSNPEIAEELFISPRTVTTHVSNILNKINAANRVEAATYASRQGLV